MLSTNKIHQHTARECGEMKSLCVNCGDSKALRRKRSGDVEKMSMIQSDQEKQLKMSGHARGVYIRI